MYNNKIILSGLLLLASLQIAVSQNNTNSPYTRFGHGDLTEGAATELRGMGGTGIANRSRNTVNVLNPASYSSVDSLTFMFDVAVGARMSRFSDAKSGGNTAFNANLEYLTMRFPLAKWLGFSAGMLPYSFLGYNFHQTDMVQVTRESAEGDKREVPFTRSFNGVGGFSQVYGGLSVNLLNHIALGVNTYYMFGESSNNRSLIFPSNSGVASSYYANQTRISDVRFRYGLQFYNTFADRHDVTLGVIYENKSQLNGTFVARMNNDTISRSSGFELPQVFGVGLNYTLNKQLTIGVDYLRQSWKDALFFDKRDSLVNRTKLSLGAEYIPNPGGRKFSDRIRYRAGISTSNPYYKVDNALQPNNLVLSFGVGLPLRTVKSWMNASIEYGRIGSSSLLREDYLKLTFSTTIDEHWFFKPRL